MTAKDACLMSEPAAMPRSGKPTDAGGFVNALSRTLGAANRYLMALMSDAGIANIVPSHGEILMQLFAAEPIAMQDLAHAIHRDPSTVTALVRKLADGGYVATAKSEADRRVTEVLLTEKGRDMHASFDAISSQLRAVQMKGIDAAAFRETCATLDAIRDNFEEAIEDRAQEEGETK